MAVSNDALRRAEEIGRRGGSVNTNGMHYNDRIKIDAAVNKGKGR